ncbi:hypothetical protein [Methylobacterium oryzihabitans]|uniref:Uncharacterized protein n=1 Tax=Methylobacterium oryzihabitans TaxID=2499852 RepID=A0A3S2VMW0_9HYPH|nr:hypothetical protein [Methylobacterium oryzihabitans]RVU12576.1 hypothetical protein EOE48_27575 [Methylobacterium oryzihabitans]
MTSSPFAIASGLSAGTLPSAAAAVDPDAFARWPEAVQAGYLRANGTGQPPAVVLGSDAARAIAALAPGGTVEITPAPAGIDAAPRDLAPADFLDWPTVAQMVYLAARGGGPIEIGPAGASLRVALATDATGTASGVTVSASDGLLDADAALFATAPADMAPRRLFALSADEQYAYAARHSRAVPPVVALAGAGADATAITLSSNGRRYEVRVPAGTFPGYDAPLAGGESAVTGLRDWPAEIRTAYVEARGAGTPYPRTAVVPADGSLWSVAGPGFEAEERPLPAGFAAAPAALDPVAFLRWPQAAQAAYLRRTVAGPEPVAIGTPPVLTAALTAGRPALALTAPATPDREPARLVLDLFQLWPQADQAAYVALWGSGSPPSVELAPAEGRPRTLLARDGAGVAIAPFPDGYETGPDALSPATFLGWPSEFRARYDAARLATPPAGLDPATFLGWPPFFRERYVAAQLGVGPGTLAIGPDAALAVALGRDGQVSIATPPARLAIEAFRSWPAAERIAYFDRTATGTPRALDLVRDAQAPLLVTVDSAGTVWSAPLPKDFGADPASVSPADFLAWAPGWQARYAAGHLAAGGTSVEIGGGTLRVTPTPDGVRVATTPDRFDLDLFRLWPPADRMAYFAANATGTPPSLDLPARAGPPSVPRLLVTLDGSGAVTAAAFPAGYPAEAGTTASPATFLGWPPAFQRLYALAHLAAGQDYAEIGTGTGAIRAIPGADGVRVTTTPAQFDLDGFRLWPAADRIAYFAAYATGTPAAIDLPRTGPGQSRLVTLDRDGTVRDAILPDNFTKAPGAVNLTSFFLSWTDAQRQTYVTRNLAGAASLDVGSPAVTVSRDAEGGLHYAATPDRLDGTFFNEWPAADRLATFNRYATGTPPALETPTSLITVDGRGTITDWRRFPLTAIPYPRDPSVTVPETTYLRWDPVFQARYDAARATLTPPLGETASILTAQRDGGYSPRPDEVTATAFAAWPEAVQADFVRAYGTGTPPVLLLAPSNGNPSIARLSAAGTSVAVMPAPADFVTVPVNLAVATFLGWPQAVQIAYAEANAATNPLAIGPATASLGVALVRDAAGRATGVTLTASAGLTASNAATNELNPVRITPERFFALTPQEQYDYVLANRTNAAPAAPSADIDLSGKLAIPGFQVVTVTLDLGGTPYRIRVPATTYSGFDTPLSGSVSTVAGTVLGWPPQVQTAYIEAHAPATNAAGKSYPKLVVFQDRSRAVVGWIPAAGRAAEVATVPPEALTATGADLATFAAWPQAAQVAYLLRQTPSGGPVTLASSSGTVAASLSGTPPGVAFAGTAVLTRRPALLDLTAFSFWTEADKATYLRAWGTGNPKTVAVPAATGRPATLMHLDAGGRVALAPFPTGYDSPPSALSPRIFLGWPSYFRNRYFADHAAGAATLTLGAGSGAVTVSKPVTSTAADGLVRIVTSAGDSLPIPYHHLIGSEQGLDPNPNKASAETLFSTLDGTPGNTIVDKPPAVQAEFGKPPGQLSPAAFNGWHTAIQLEYLRREMTGTPPRVEIGPAGSTITAFISESGTKVYVAEMLEKQDIARMSLGDQTTLAQLPAFQEANGLGDRLGLIGQKASVPAGQVNARGEVQAMIAAALSRINNPRLSKTDPNYSPGGDGLMPDADRQLFRDQINNIGKTFDGMAIFSKTEIDKQIDEVLKRFDRANAFAVNVFRFDSRSDGWPYLMDTARNPSGVVTGTNSPIPHAANGGTPIMEVIAGSPGYTGTVTIGTQVYDNPQAAFKTLLSQHTPRVPAYDSNGNGSVSLTLNPPVRMTVKDPDGKTFDFTLSHIGFKASKSAADNSKMPVSTDDGQKIRNGYDTFIAQEKQLLGIQNARLGLAQDGMFQNRALDVPNLVYLFQLYANLAGEAKVRIATEEVEQINALLKTYAVLQAAINRTVGAFNPDPKDQKLAYGGEKVGLSEDEKTVGKMFWQGSGYDKVPHPIEALLGVPRPAMGWLMDTTSDSRRMSSTTWQQYQTTIGDAVSRLNQESQIKMNEINSMTKQKDRNFDLANNALSKMAEIVQKVASAA